MRNPGTGFGRAHTVLPADLKGCRTAPALGLWLKYHWRSLDKRIRPHRQLSDKLEEGALHPRAIVPPGQTPHARRIRFPELDFNKVESVSSTMENGSRQ